MMVTKKVIFLMTCVTIIRNSGCFAAYPGTFLVMLPKTLRPSSPRQNLPLSEGDPDGAGANLQNAPTVSAQRSFGHTPLDPKTNTKRFILSMFPPNDLKSQLHQNGNPDNRVRFQVLSPPVTPDTADFLPTTTTTPSVSQISPSRLTDIIRLRCSMTFDQDSAPCKTLKNAISIAARQKQLYYKMMLP